LGSRKFKTVWPSYAPRKQGNRREQTTWSSKLPLRDSETGATKEAVDKLKNRGARVELRQGRKNGLQERTATEWKVYPRNDRPSLHDPMRPDIRPRFELNLSLEIIIKFIAGAGYARMWLLRNGSARAVACASLKYFAPARAIMPLLNYHITAGERGHCRE